MNFVIKILHFNNPLLFNKPGVVLMITVEWLLLIFALSSSAKPDDSGLYHAIKKGDQNAFKTFFNKHNKEIFRFLVSRGVDPHVAEELVQKAFVIIWEKRSEIDPGKSLRAYLFQTAYTRMLNHIRDQKKFQERDVQDKDAGNRAPDEILENEQLKIAIDRAVQKLPEKRRMVFEFCFLKDFTYKDTADVMDISVKTVENHMALALKELRQTLNEFQKK